MLGISFMQGIYTYIPETNHVPKEHCVATILMQLFMVRISLVPALTALYLYVSLSPHFIHSLVIFCRMLPSLISSFLQALLYFTPVCFPVFWAWWL